MTPNAVRIICRNNEGADWQVIVRIQWDPNKAFHSYTSDWAHVSCIGAIREAREWAALLGVGDEAILVNHLRLSKHKYLGMTTSQLRLQEPMQKAVNALVPDPSEEA